MRILALELSTETGTLAWLEEDQVRWEKKWAGDGRRRPVFADLYALVREGGLEWSRIDRLAVGVGPGAFSGLRAAVSLMQGLALPDQKPLTAVSSARALARSILKETGAPRVVVLGDARRHELWAGCFAVEEGVVQPCGDWIVAPPGALPDFLKAAGTVWVSPDWSGLGATLEEVCPPTVTLLREVRRPSAAMVGGVVGDLVSRGKEGEPAVPIYVHPAVSIAPRF